MSGEWRFSSRSVVLSLSKGRRTGCTAHTLESKNPRDGFPGDFIWHWVGLADDGDVAGLRTLGSLLDLELNLLAFFQVLETFALNGGEVDEDIRAAFASEESVALASVEPFDCAGDTLRHCLPP